MAKDLDERPLVIDEAVLVRLLVLPLEMYNRDPMSEGREGQVRKITVVPCNIKRNLLSYFLAVISATAQVSLLLGG